jgi:CubicO group peptidase (beta-lactamase class C family)
MTVPRTVLIGVLTIAGAAGSAGAAPTAATAPATGQAAAAATVPAAQPNAPRESELDRLRRQRHEFQAQELVTGAPYTYIFSPGQPPRIVWRDLQRVRELGCLAPLRVRWFDADLNETDGPRRPGRWGALVETVAPTGSPVRRALTFYCRPPGFLVYLQPHKFSVELPPQPGPIAAPVWAEHQDEIDRLLTDQALRGLNDGEAGVVLIAALAESKPLGRPPLSIDTAAVRDADYHLALKLKVEHLADKVRPLAPPRHVSDPPAPVLHEGTTAEAGVRPDAKEKIDAVCRAWADDSGEPFVTLVARHGVIVTHEAFNPRNATTKVNTDFRWDVFSITKSITALLFSRFLDQGLVRLDDPVSSVFPNYPRSGALAAHVPTFRECFTHTSGLSGHGEFGGSSNAWLENVLLNGLDANVPGKRYEYTGMGFDLAGKAMEIVAGKSLARLYYDDLFVPLGIGDVPVPAADAGARPTARQLAALGQLLANRGRYGDREFFSLATFETLLPEQLGRRFPGVNEEEGIGMHWLRPTRAGAKAGSTRPADLIFSPHTVGHGSLSSCIFLIDLDRGWVVTQIRRTAGPRYAEWSQKFFQTIAASAAD